MHFRCTLVAFVTTVVAIAPGAAHAATVTSTSRTVADGPHDELSTYTTVAFTAAPGEHNVMAVRRTDGTAASSLERQSVVYTVTDTGGAPLTAGEGCTAQPDGSVACTVEGSYNTFHSFRADLGDGDDSATIAPSPSDSYNNYDLRGGPGSDVLDASASGPDSSATLDGGDGDDTELGGSGEDTFTGDAGHDRIVGGADRDTVVYRWRTDPVRATLGAPQPGDEDDITGVEQLNGGYGDDHLTGSDGADEIDGGPGADVIDGRGGDDHLSGGLSAAESGPMKSAGEAPTGGGVADGPDVVHGGDGNDDITLYEAGRADGGAGDDGIDGGSKRSTVSGGPGHDRLTGTLVRGDDDGAAGDYVTCTRGGRAVLGAGDVSHACRTHLRRTGGAPGALAIYRIEPVDVMHNSAQRFTLALWCADEAAAAGCRARIAVLDGAGRTVASRVTRLRRSQQRDVGISYNKSFSARLAKAGALPVTFVVRTRDARGHARSDRVSYCAQSASIVNREPIACR